MYQGSIVALVTPMHTDGSIDKQSFQDLIEWHIRSKTSGIVVAGTTGEGSTLSADEQFELITLAVKLVAGRIPVIAGTGSNSTATTIKLTLNAEKAGANASLIVTPYYNKPTQEGLYQHYKAVAEATHIPIILYNVPGRTGCDLLPATIERLAQLPNIIGVKEATGKLERTIEIIERCGPQFMVLSGNDATTLACIRLGAKGVISVTANVAPEKMQEMCTAALNGDKSRAEQLNRELDGLHNKLFIESNPIPTKWALHQMKRIPAGIRLPLTTLDAKHYQDVSSAMQQAGI